MMLNIEEIKAREQAATPGPWVSVFDLKGFTIYDMSGEKGNIIAKLRNSKCKYKQPDATFIAHARTDVPALIAEAERLTTENKKIRAQLDRFVETDFKVGAENATLERALELACNEVARRKVGYVTDIPKESADFMNYFIQQAQEGEK